MSEILAEPEVVAPDSSVLVTSEPARERLRDAYATSFRRRREHPDDLVVIVKGALYRSDGSLVELSQRVSGVMGDRVQLEDPRWIQVRRVPRVGGRGLYLGNLFNHYGHFVTEGLGPLWPLARGERYDYYAAHPFIFGSDRPAWMKHAFEVLGISDRALHVIREPTIFRDLTIPERTWQANRSVNVAFREIVDLVAARADGLDLKVYLSRSRVANRPIANEGEIEREFAGRGFTVVHPQDLPFSTQLDLFARAGALAGFAGSQLHNLLFCRPGTRLISIGDGRRLPLMPNQRLCNAIRESPAVVVPFAGSGETFDLAALGGAFARLG